MSDQAQPRELRDALAVAPREQARAARHPRHRHAVRDASEGAHPREFDAWGFPIPQRTRNFLERVARY